MWCCPVSILLCLISPSSASSTKFDVAPESITNRLLSILRVHLLLFVFLISCFSGIMLICSISSFISSVSSLSFCLRSSRFFFFSSSGCFLSPGSFLSFLMRDIICFIASVLLLIRLSICCVCFSVSAAINSSVASACSSIMFALKFFAVSLFCLFSFACSAEMKVLMFCQVLLTVGLFSHSLTAASNSPEAFK